MDKINLLLSAMDELPPDMKKIESILKEEKYSSYEMMSAIYRFSEKYLFEYEDYEWMHNRKPEANEIHSRYIYSICRLFLEYGFDPAVTIEENGRKTNIWENLQYLECGAKTARLLLEKGCNGNISVLDYNIFEELDFDVVFDITEGYDASSHFEQELNMWLVMIGFGATVNDGKCPLNIADGFESEMFRNFENFIYSIEICEGENILHIIDKESWQEAAWL